MKKIFALILALMLCACALAEPKTIDLETMTLEDLEALRAEVDAAIDALSAADAEEEPDDRTVQIAPGDTIALGAVELTFESFGLTKEIYDDELACIVSESGENSTLAYVYAVTEAGYEDFSACVMGSHARYEFVVDGEHVIDATPYNNLEMRLALGYNPKPTSDVWLSGDVHNDLLADYESLVLRIYYRESYTYEDSQTYLDADSADVIYELDMTPDALTEYTDKATIKAVQAAMNELGFECGTPDGVSGKKTAAAISAFQAEQGLTETGTVTHETLKALRGMGMNV